MDVTPLLEAFREGGASMYLITLVDGCLCSLSVFVLVGVVFAAKRGARALRGVAAVVLLGAFVPVCAGGAGYLLGMRNVEAALAAADEKYAEELRTIGQREASQNLWFGGGSSALCLLSSMALLGLVFALTRSDEDPTAPR